MMEESNIVLDFMEARDLEITRGPPLPPLPSPTLLYQRPSPRLPKAQLTRRPASATTRRIHANLRADVYKAQLEAAEESNDELRNTLTGADRSTSVRAALCTCPRYPPVHTPQSKGGPG